MTRILDWDTVQRALNSKSLLFAPIFDKVFANSFKILVHSYFFESLFPPGEKS